MELKKAATAGTLESSDCMVTVEHRVSAIETAVEYGNRRIFARIRHAGRVENTRFVHVDEVGNRIRTRR